MFLQPPVLYIPGIRVTTAEAGVFVCVAVSVEVGCDVEVRVGVLLGIKVVVAVAGGVLVLVNGITGVESTMTVIWAVGGLLAGASVVFNWVGLHAPNKMIALKKTSAVRLLLRIAMDGLPI